MTFTYLSRNFRDTDFAGFAAYCSSRHYDRDDVARSCNLISRLHNAGLSDTDLISISWETLCSLIRGRPYDNRIDKKIAGAIRRYLDYLNTHCRSAARKPVDLTKISIEPLVARHMKSTLELIISYLQNLDGIWVESAELSKRFNLQPQSLTLILSGCNSIEISRPSDYRDMVRYRYVSLEAA